MDIIKVGDTAGERATDRSGIVTEINSKGRARIVRGPKETWWAACSSLERLEPADLGGGFRFGQFVKRPGRDQVGMMLDFAEGSYTMLCADAKCYPKGTKYAAGKWYRADEIMEVTAEEKEVFLFKLNPVHTSYEYASNLERIAAKWERKGLGEAAKRFMFFWARVLKGIGDRPGITWGARLLTIYSPAPSINFHTENPEDLHANMFGFFDLLNEAGGPALAVFIKRSDWIPEAAKALFPKNREEHFYMDGHWTLIPLAGKSDKDIIALADTLSDIYRSAGGARITVKE